MIITCSFVCKLKTFEKLDLIWMKMRNEDERVDFVLTKKMFP